VQLASDSDAAFGIAAGADIAADSAAAYANRALSSGVATDADPGARCGDLAADPVRTGQRPAGASWRDLDASGPTRLRIDGRTLREGSAPEGEHHRSSGEARRD
jgi:hypothetical protein